MIKRISLISMVLLLFVGFGYATTKSSMTSKSSSKKSSYSHSKSSMKEEGTIQKVDLATNSIQVQIGSDTKTFKFSDKTMWMKDGKKTRSADLKVGDKVIVYSDSKNFARRIEASPHTS